MTFYLKIYFEIKLIYNTFRVCILIVLFFFGLSCNQQKPVNLDVGNANSVQHQEPTLLLKYTIEDADWIVKTNISYKSIRTHYLGWLLKLRIFFMILLLVWIHPIQLLIFKMAILSNWVYFSILVPILPKF